MCKCLTLHCQGPSSEHCRQDPVEEEEEEEEEEEGEEEEEEDEEE